MTRFAWILLLNVALACTGITASQTIAQEEVWEFSPYRVRVWISMSPTLGLSDESKQHIHRRIVENAEIEFGATTRTDVLETPDALFGSVLYHLDDLTVEQLLSRELVLMLSKTDAAKEAFMASQPKKALSDDGDKPTEKLSRREEEERKAKLDAEARAASINSVRTLESVIERVPQIAIQPMQLAALKRDIVPYLGDAKWNAMQSKLAPVTGGPSALIQGLESGKYFAALVPKTEAARLKDVARSIPTRFPWQPEAMLRDKDKIVLVSVDRAGEGIRIQVKELDAFVRRIGLMESLVVQRIDEIPHAVAYLQRRSFTPMARIEDNDNRTAVVRVRAIGLATSDDSPVRIGPGDVLSPYLRRDDLNGNPTVLQNIAFTYIAVTEPIDTARFFGAIFTASRGALVAAKNRRTKRVALRIDPRFELTQLKLGVRQMPASAVPGAEVYLRTPGTQDLSIVGRTDWRGMIDLTEQKLPTIVYDAPTSSSVESIANARLTVSTGEPIPSPDAGATPPAESKEEALKRRREKPPTSSIQINVPLYLYYIKNGETLLARLPIITGYREQERAELPDDRRRLQAEAFLKGLQAEVLDLVVRRKILVARIRKKLEDGKAEDAQGLLDELKKVKNYEGMSAQIQAIQRRAFATESGAIPGPVAERIDKMVDSTRVLMQKYLQDDLVRELEVKLIELKQQQ